MTDGSSLFVGRSGELGAAAVEVALRAGASGNAALLFGSIASLNGKPFWVLRTNLKDLYKVSTRTITRYFRQLVDLELIVNEPAPLGAIHPGLSRSLPYRPWYKWAIGLPQMRDAIRARSRDTYQKWVKSFEAARQERVTRTKLGAIIGQVWQRRPPKPVPRADSSYRTDPPRRAWTADELDAELARVPVGSTLDASPERPPDTS